LDIICNWKTDCPKPNGDLIFTDVKEYGTAIDAYTVETIEFLETYSCGTDEILKELKLSLCPEAIVCLSRDSARAWKRFLHQRGIPVETSRHQTTRGMLMDRIFSEDKNILEMPPEPTNSGSKTISVAQEMTSQRTRRNTSSTEPLDVSFNEKLNIHAQGQLSKMYLGRPKISGGVGEDLENTFTLYDATMAMAGINRILTRLQVW
jgi:hypothetical protein